MQKTFRCKVSRTTNRICCRALLYVSVQNYIDEETIKRIITEGRKLYTQIVCIISLFMNQKTNLGAV